MAVGSQRVYHKRDRLRQLRAFCRAARLESITQAADSLGLSQPAVSLHVRELENELEAILFDRSGARISLTPAGKRLYDLAKPLAQGMDDLSTSFVERLDYAIPGRLHLAASPAGAAFVLPPYVKRFRDQYPNIRLRVRNCLLAEGVKLLLDDRVELVLGVNDPYPEDAVDYFELLPYDIVLITPLDHPLAGRETVTPEEAAAWPAIIPAPGTYSRRFGETAAKQFGVEAKAVIEIGGWGVIKSYVAKGFGVSVVPSICIHETDQLSVIPLGKYFRSRSYGVFTRRGKFLSRAARCLIRLIAPDFPDPSSPPRTTR